MPSLDQQIAHAAFRFALGVNMAVHGAVRIFGVGKLPAFVANTTRDFEKTILPTPLVQLFASTLPLIELALGIALILGLGTRWAALGGALLMASLMFGMGLREQWATVGTQLVYSVAFFLLGWFNAPNRFSLDGLRAPKKRA